MHLSAVICSSSGPPRRALRRARAHRFFSPGVPRAVGVTSTLPAGVADRRRLLEVNAPREQCVADVPRTHAPVVADQQPPGVSIHPNRFRARRPVRLRAPGKRQRHHVAPHSSIGHVDELEREGPGQAPVRGSAGGARHRGVTPPSSRDCTKLTIRRFGATPGPCLRLSAAGQHHVPGVRLGWSAGRRSARLRRPRGPGASWSPWSEATKTSVPHRTASTVLEPCASTSATAQLSARGEPSAPTATRRPPPCRLK